MEGRSQFGALHQNILVDYVYKVVFCQWTIKRYIHIRNNKRINNKKKRFLRSKVIEATRVLEKIVEKVC